MLIRKRQRMMNGNWRRNSTITYVNEVDGEEQDLKAGTSYKIYTRIPESDNYLAK